MTNTISAPNLLEPHDQLGLRNRIVMAPMTRCRCDCGGLPSAELADYYVSRAKAGIGLVIIESCAVNDSDAAGYLNGCQMNHAAHADAWRPIVHEIHRAGAKVWVQLFHAGRLSVPEIFGGIPIAPSPLRPEGDPSFWRPAVDGEIVHFQTRTRFAVPREMDGRDIERVLSEFGQSCQLAASAGFDGIELHGAHGYLIHQFCSKFSNLRDDEYATSRGFLFASRMVEQCRSKLPSEILLSYRLSRHMIDNFYLGQRDMAMEQLVPILDHAGVDVFHSSELQLGESVGRSGTPLGETIKGLTKKPIIGCGRVRSLNEAAAVMARHPHYDLIAFGRTLIMHGAVPQDFSEPAFDYAEHFAKL